MGWFEWIKRDKTDIEFEENFRKEQEETENKKEELKKINKVKEKLEEFEDDDGSLVYGNLKYNEDFDEKYEDEPYSKYVLDGGVAGIFHKKDKKKKYSFELKNVFDKVIKNNFDIEKTLEEIEAEIEYNLQIDKFKEKERKRKIRENAEKDFYGRIKSKRDNISQEKKEDILRKFNSKCAICGKEEGLHIHHKDSNPKNNQLDNLIVLCGVCHKKIHMKVR